MAGEQPNVDSIFCEAIEFGSPDEREQFVRDACGDDQQLRREVERLLRAHFGAGSFLKSAPAVPDISPTIDQPIQEGPGARIGPYKLLQQIGEGGMGVVYMAEQKEPVRRRVALKIIKPGMDTRQVIARFEAERQALAMMDHPHIAKVLDAGQTDSGRPYFVMELVRGVPVTEYCDQQHLNPRERLELFLPICQAVQHAHQKGIIHRDLKPSNILVALYDGRPVPKVIDFGVAKATSQALTERTMFTQFGQVVGTLEYMSPEQAEVNQLDVDTRSDIYSLGVLLYELLTGDTPFDRERLRSAAFDEILRIIREEEPPKPSTRLSGSATLPSVAASRRMEPQKLGLTIRGELDWIVMKALDKDRGRRYETASKFAEDIEHYLNDEAVVACPPSSYYRFRKFARRNRSAMLTAGAAACLLVAITIVTALAAARFRRLADNNASLLTENRQALAAETEAKNAARLAQQVAEAARKQEQALREEAQRQTVVAERALEDARQQRERAEQNLARAQDAVDEFLNQVTDHELLSVPGLQPLRRDLLLSSLRFYQEFSEQKADDPALQAELAAAHYRIGRIQRELGQSDLADASIREAVDRYAQLREAGHDTLDVKSGLAHALFYSGRHEDAVALCKLILTTHPQDETATSLLAETYNSLAIKAGEDDAAALNYHRQALPLRQELVDRFPDKATHLAALGSTLNNLGVLLSKRHHRREAEDIYRQATAYKARAYELAPHSLQWGGWLVIGLRNEASLLRRRGLDDLALQRYRQVVDVRRKLVFDNPAVESLKGELAKAWLDLGNYQKSLQMAAESERSLRRVVEILEQMPRETPVQLFSLAAAYANLAVPPETQPAAPAADEDSPGESETPGDEAADEFAAQQREYYAHLAIETLRQAVDDGFADMEAFVGSQPLQALAELDEHRAAIEDIRLALQRRSATASDESDTAGAEELAARRAALPLFQQLRDDLSPEVRRQATLAAAAHAVGALLTRMDRLDEAEAPLQQARSIRESLLKAEPDVASFQAELGGTRIALGTLFWSQNRLPEAVEEFEEGLELLYAAGDAAPDNIVVQQQVADWERRAFDRYARLGLWAEASEHARRNLQLQRVSQLTWDTRFALLLGLSGDVAGQQRYAQLIAERESPGAPLTLMASCTVPRPAMTDEQLIEWADAIEFSGSDWREMMAAIANYRSGRYQRALELVRLSGDYTHNLYRKFWLAMIYDQLDRPEQAEKALAEAEASYRELGERCVTQSSVQEEFGDIWERLVHTQLVRQEAWREVAGDDPPPDPWQHLIAARGYWLIGQTARAEAAFAAAVEKAPRDLDVRAARAELFARLGLSDRSEADWTAAIELDPEDPRPWLRRGRWHAGHDRGELAAADFEQAANLAAARELWSLRAEGLEQLGRWQEAIEDLGRAIADSPQDAGLRMRRAALYGKTGQPREAVENFCRANGWLPPFISESGWELSRSVVAAGAQAAVVHPHDGRLLIGLRDSKTDGVYVVEQDHSLSQIAEGDRLLDLVVDPASGDIFFSEDHAGRIGRIAADTQAFEVWAPPSRFKPADSDPCGIAIVPGTFAGDGFQRGDVIVVDRGWKGADEIYLFSLSDPQQMQRLHSDADGGGLLVNVQDVAVTSNSVYVADSGTGRILRLSVDGDLTPIETAVDLGSPVAIAADPRTDELYLLDSHNNRLLRVNPLTGAVGEVASDLHTSWNSRLDVTPDGQRIVITLDGLVLVLTASGPHEAAPPTDADARINRYSDLIRRDPANWAALRARADLYREQRQNAEAVADYTALLSGGLEDAHLLDSRSVVHCRQGDFDAALRDSNRAVELDPQSYILAHRAWPLVMLGNYEQAIADCDRALELDPTNASALSRRAWAREMNGQADQSIPDAVAAVKLAPDSEFVWRRLYRCSLKVEDPASLASLDELRGILEQNPALLSTHGEALAKTFLLRAELLAKQGEAAAALADSEVARRLAPRSTIVLNHRGWRLREARNWEQAAVAYGESLQVEANVEALVGRGTALIELGKYDDAIADLERALELEPGHGTARLHRGWARQMLGQTPAAMADTVAVLNANPKSGWAWRRLHSVVRAARKPEDVAALDELREFVAEDASRRSRCGDRLAEALLIRAALREQAGDAEGARADRRSAEEFGTRLTILEHRSRRLWESQQWEPALEAFRQVSKLKPDRPEAVHRIAACLLQLDDVEGYRRHCREMLQRHQDTDNVHLAEAIAKSFSFYSWPAAELRKPLEIASRGDDQWTLLNHGALLYRAKQFEASLEKLSQALECWEGDDWAAAVHLRLAMTHHALGNGRQAGESFARGKQWLASHPEKPWPNMQRLCDEVDRLLSPAAAAPASDRQAPKEEAK